ncbi:glycosyltransferase [Novacetimonas hansenii]|uniref:glycosyltransferase n=1 Tax=Novacetimonas hansenii TaxID=436 RepID=UPI00094F54F7|nr:glycosyltransferase [Novacetimonas hansenii]
MNGDMDDFIEGSARRYILSLSSRYDELLPPSQDLALVLGRLEYLQRAHPSARDIMLGIGLCRLAIGEPRASEPLEYLSLHATSPIARFFLLLTRLRFGAHDRTFGELRAFLREVAVVYEHVAFVVFSILSGAHRCGGWCAMQPDGRIVIGLEDGTDNDDIRWRHDDTEYQAELRLVGGFGGFSVYEITNFELPSHLPAIHVLHNGRDMLGSALESRTIWRCEGFVEGSSEGLTGWFRHPNNLASVDHVWVRAADGDTLLFDGVLGDVATDFLVAEKERTAFLIPWGDLAGVETPCVRVMDRFQQEFYGSPLDPLAGARYARAQAQWVARTFPTAYSKVTSPEFNQPFPALYTPQFAQQGLPAACREARRNRVAVIIPVYKGYEVTKECIELALQWRGPDERLVVINDFSPDPRIVDFLETVAGQEGITVLCNARNRGFTYSANRGLREVGGDEDAILLNSDTIPPPGWIGKLRDAIYRAPDIGTATPLSNAATIFSYPRNDGNNPIPSYDEVVELSSMLEEIGNAEIVEVPTGHGFCMYIRAECLHQTGVLREDVFAQGYGEENDFSRRAASLGWRHVVCLGIYVGHAEGQSFSAFKGDLIRRNLGLLNGLHPGYDRLVNEWQKRDPLHRFRRELDVRRLSQAVAGRHTVALMTHDREGGVHRFVQERALAIVEDGRIPLIISPCPADAPDGYPRWEVVPYLADDYPNIILSRRGPDLRELLLSLNCEKMEIHSYIGAGIKDIHWVSLFGLAYDVYLHDYSWFCPQITLVSHNNLYCGEPEASACETCVMDRGRATSDDTALSLLRELSTDILRRARVVIASCEDVATRYRRHIDVAIVLEQWEAPVTTQDIIFRPRHPTDIRRVLLIGAIGIEKGYDILLRLARYVASTGLPLRFSIVGFTCDDSRLLETGVVDITGSYAENELTSLIQMQHCDWGFLPAVWPETWSYVLTEFWRHKFPVVTFDIGAPAERIRMAGGGLVIPLHLPVASLANILLNPAHFIQS